MAYTTSNALAAYLGVDSIADDTLLTDCVTRAQTAIDTRCRRTFEAATETRYYRPEDLIEDTNGRYVLMLSDRDLLSITTLTNGDAQAISGTHIELLPRNTTAKRYVRLKTTHTGWTFSDADSVITIVGSWGFATTAPADIVQATIRMAAYLYRQRDVSDFDVSATPEQGMIRVPMGLPKDVERLTAPYLRRTIA